MSQYADPAMVCDIRKPIAKSYHVFFYIPFGYRKFIALTSGTRIQDNLNYNHEKESPDLKGTIGNHRMPIAPIVSFTAEVYHLKFQD